MSDELDSAAIEAALQYLEETLAPLGKEERDEWQDVLIKLRPGELRPAVERWQGRPKPYALLDYVLTAREPLEAPEPPPRAQRQVTPTIQQIIDKAKADIGPWKKPTKHRLAPLERRRKKA
jgi:hypothetical protein